MTVIQLNNSPALDDKGTLQAAIDEQWSSVIIIGYDETGAMCLKSSREVSYELAVLMLSFTKRTVLKDFAELVGAD